MDWRRVQPRAPWRARAMPRGGQLDGWFYVLSGRAGWELVAARTGWGRRCYPEVEIADGVIVLTAGQSLRTFHNDVWHSYDHGRTWQRVCASAPWGVRAGHHPYSSGAASLLTKS